MLIIGLCGGTGSGKGTVADLFKIYAVPSIDSDKLYHELTGRNCPLTLKLAEIFGESVIGADGSLNRKALSSIVFAPGNENALQTLNSVTHRAIIEESEKIIDKHRASGAPAVIFDAPLLFESGFNEKCDVIVSVIADDRLRMARIMRRDSIDEQMARRRIQSQKSNEFLIRNSDYVIINNGDFTALKDEVDRVAKNIFYRGK